MSLVERRGSKNADLFKWRLCGSSLACRRKYGIDPEADVMSERASIRAMTCVASLVAASLLVFAVQSSAHLTRSSDARDRLELCAASKGVLCDAPGDATVQPMTRLCESGRFVIPTMSEPRHENHDRASPRLRRDLPVRFRAAVALAPGAIRTVVSVQDAAGAAGT
jgi:hypothetical protein